MRKKLLRLVRIAPLALLLASPAYAETTGTIIGVVTDASTGKPVEGAVIIATSPTMQGEQTAITGKDGSYRLAQLPGGQYRLMVQIAGYKPADRSDIRLNVDRTLRANMAVVPEAVQLEEQVVRSSVAPIVNVGSAESGQVVSREYLNSIPTGRTFQAVAASVPQASNDNYGVGFAGAQSPENGYIVDGLNVTDPVYGAAAGTWSGRNAPTLLASFIQEVDVKTGSFMPEYGRATGGIINVVTKSGSNEFHGSVFSNFRPDFLVMPNSKNGGVDGEAINFFQKPGSGSYNLDYGGELGGPIMKDKLWFYAGFAPIVNMDFRERFLQLNQVNSASAPCTTDPFDALHRCRDANGFAVATKVPGSSIGYHDEQVTYQWVGKLTYLINENNSVALSHYGSPSTRIDHLNKRLQDENANAKTKIDSYDTVAKYTGKFANKRIVIEALGGWHRQIIQDQPNAYQRNTPGLTWNDPTNSTGYALTAFQPIAGCTSVAQCPVTGFGTGGFGVLQDQTIDRFAGKASVGGYFTALGNHSAKIGVDLERNDFDQSKAYAGGLNFTPSVNAANGPHFRVFRGYGTYDGTLHPTPTVATKSYSNSFSYFVQDSWQVLDTGLTINAGLRLETQKMVNKINTDNVMDIKDSWAPRLQAVWDFTRNGRGKVSASWGRFYWSVPLDMGDRAFGAETEIRFRQPWDAATFRPAGSAACFNNYMQPWAGDNAAGDPKRYDPVANGGAVGVYSAFDPRNLVNASGGPGCASANSFAQSGGGFTPVQPGLKATSVDMFGGGIEYEVLPDLSVSATYDGRRQGNVIEDMAPNGSDYFIANPGTATWTDPVAGPLSSKVVDAPDYMTSRTLQIPVPKPERSYDALTLKVNKNFSRSWQAYASYTYSVTRGYYGGPFDPFYGGGGGQLDPGITALYDLPTFYLNGKGLLPSDRPHQVKLASSYTWNLGPRFSVTASGAYTGQSGIPVSVLAAEQATPYGNGISNLIPRGTAGRTPFTHALDLGARVGYVIRAPYEVRLSVDVLNALNSQRVTDIDNNYTTNESLPIPTSCKNSAGGKANPIGVLQAACPDLAFSKTSDGRPVTPNPNYGKADAGTASYQVPLQLRLGLTLAF
jgi:hypothetical protein